MRTRGRRPSSPFEVQQEEEEKKETINRRKEEEKKKKYFYSKTEGMSLIHLMRECETYEKKKKKTSDQIITPI